MSWIVNLGDFAMRSVVSPATVGAGGATRAFPMNVVRAEDLALPLDLSVTATAPPRRHALGGAPRADGRRLHLGPDHGAPPGTASGLYPVTVTASTAPASGPLP